METPLGVLWRRSVLVASLSCVIARRMTTVNPDTALLAGLLQGIGRLYILTRASGHRALFADQDSYQAIEQDWHLSIAAALLENWGFADEIVQAVHESENLEREVPRPAGAGRCVGRWNDSRRTHNQPQVLHAQVQCAKPLQRLKLDAAACEAFITESQTEIDRCARRWARDLRYTAPHSWERLPSGPSRWVRRSPAGWRHRSARSTTLRRASIGPQPAYRSCR